MKTNLSFENTGDFLIENRVFAPASDIVANAHITSYMNTEGFAIYEDFYQWSLDHRNEFWDDMARELHRLEPWQTTYAWTEKPFFTWFDRVHIQYRLQLP
jgi:acetyl-CoA synthetase